MAAGEARAERSPAALTETAPAKINLYLHVVGRRADGYHRIDSLIVFADVGDRLTVAPAAALSLEVTGPFAAALEGEAVEDNLVLRAARLLQRAGDVRDGAAIRLEKRLPVAAGLGGGSADAAAALRALARLWRLRPASGDLMGIACALGADVPVCLESRPAFVAGIGEAIAPAPPLPAFHLALVNPGVRLATAAVFAAREGPFSAPARFAESPADAAAFAALLEERRNDLEEPARALAPQAAAPGPALAATRGCLLARMSGSGATWFGLFAEAAEAEAAARALARDWGWWAAACRPAPGPAGTYGRRPVNDFPTAPAAL